jgi:RNA polymerase sigma-70 factor (ECF subfamily)
MRTLLSNKLTVWEYTTCAFLLPVTTQAQPMTNAFVSDPSTWLDEHGDAMYRFALNRLHSEELAEDMVQETLLAAWQAFDKFTGQSSERTWLIGIMKHKIIDHYRKNYRESDSLDEFADEDALMAHAFDSHGHWKIKLINWGTPDSAFADNQFWQVFHRCLARLPKAMVDLFMLRAVDDLAVEDCCKLLAMETTNQLNVALSRTRFKLRQCLEVHWFE